MKIRLDEFLEIKLYAVKGLHNHSAMPAGEPYVKDLAWERVARTGCEPIVNIYIYMYTHACIVHAHVHTWLMQVAYCSLQSFATNCDCPMVGEAAAGAMKTALAVA